LKFSSMEHGTIISVFQDNMNWDKTTGICDCGKIQSCIGIYMPGLRTKERKLTMVMVPLMTVILLDSEDAHYCYEHKVIMHIKWFCTEFGFWNNRNFTILFLLYNNYQPLFDAAGYPCVYVKLLLLLDVSQYFVQITSDLL
jgi:hypothetical protein